MAAKPQNILELGIGSGLVTRSLMAAIRYNQYGTLTSVDNWLDWGRTRPELDIPPEVKVIASEEEVFVRLAPTDEYDMLISDADHDRSGLWFTEHCRIVKPDGFMFFHDTNQPQYPTLFALQELAKARALPYFHFTKSTREDERCERGLLFVINRK